MEDRQFSAKVLKDLTKANHYNNWIFELFSSSLGKKIIEVGSSQFFVLLESNEQD